MNYRAVLFDLDGTVLSTLQDLYTSTNAALAMHRLPPRTLDEVRRFLGNGMEYLISHAVPSGTDAEVTAQVLSDFKQHYAAHCEVETKPYDGILEMLTALRRRGIRTALVSNKGDFAVQKLATHYFADCFDFVLGETAEIRRKPAPDMVHKALEVLNIPLADAVFIGDSEVDVQTAKNAGVNGIFVTWGFRDRACLAQAGATQILDHVEALTAALLA
jgi:phosphoglycolate phosphatase